MVSVIILAPMLVLKSHAGQIYSRQQTKRTGRVGGAKALDR